MKKYILLIIILSVVVTVGVIRKVFVIRDSAQLNDSIMELSYKSNAALLRSGKSTLMISNQIERAWNDSIKYIIFAKNTKRTSTILNEKLGDYNSANSIVVVTESVGKEPLMCFDDAFYRNVVIDSTKLFDFILTDTLPISVLSIRKSKTNHFEISERSGS